MTNRTAPKSGLPGFRWKWILGLFFGLLALALVAGLIVGGVVYNSLMEYKSPESYGARTFLDAKYAADKLRLLEQSTKNNEKGFVRLNEPEINSLLHLLFFAGKAKPLSSFSDPPKSMRAWVSEGKPKTTNPDACQMLDVRVRFIPENSRLDWHCWVKKTWHGTTRTLQWERQVRLERNQEGWGYIVEEMKVGRRVIPPEYWDFTNRFLGEADGELREPFKWFQKLPAVEIKPNDTTQIQELVLYNYPEPGVASKPSP
jgi:hypothetical protein